MASAMLSLLSLASRTHSSIDKHIQAISRHPEVLPILSLQDMAHLIKRLRLLLGDLTFLEAYERTGEGS